MSPTEQAIACLEEVLRHYNSYSYAYELLGLVHEVRSAAARGDTPQETDNLPAARSAFELAAEARSDSASTWRKLADIYL